MAKKLPKIISKDEVLQLFKGINRSCPTGCRNYALLTMLYRAGLRVSEACNLTVPDVNFKTGQIYVQEGKGGKDRYVPMDNDITQACQAWGEMKELGGIKSEYFFCTLNGSSVDPRYLREVCRRLSDKAGVFIQDGRKKKPVHPHAFRHSCFTEMLREGELNIREIQQMAGHSNINTTEIYTHVIQDELAEKIQNRPSMVPVN